jgi:hypothetical protein
MQVFMAVVIILSSAIGIAGDNPMLVSENAIKLLTAFKQEKKFGPTDDQTYTGIQNPLIRAAAAQLMNKAADDFIQVARSHPTEEKFQEMIKTGLKRFSSIYLDLDTEDRESVCRYYEHLMDIVGLESSGGHLNEWMYSFDPNKSQE